MCVCELVYAHIGMNMYECLYTPVCMCVYACNAVYVHFCHLP